MFERYTGEARRALFFSRFEAARLGFTAIDTRHLLLGLMNLKTGFIKRTLAHIPVDEIRQEIAPGANHQATPETAKAEIPFADDLRRAMHHAADEADRLRQDYIGAEHLLLGLLREGTSADLLQRRGVRLDDVRAIVAQQAQEPLRFTVEESPDPELMFTAYDPALHSAFAFILAQGPLAGTAGHSAVLTNLASRRITAVVARWTVTDPAGGTSTKHVVRDDYFPPPRFECLVPGATVLVTPGGFHEAISGPHAWVAGDGWRLDHDAAAITVALDSVVFDDGRVIGADEYGIADHIHGRHAAALDLMRQVREAEAAGEDVDAMLRAISNSTRDTTERTPWRRRLAARALHVRPWLESLRHLPEPPRFWR